MIASMWAAFSSTRTARDRCVVGHPVPLRIPSDLLDESAWIGDVGACRGGMAPSASAAERTAERNVYSASPRSMYSVGAPVGTEYTVHDNDGSAPVSGSVVVL